MKTCENAAINRWLPGVVRAAGLLLVVNSFFVGPGIPYQDPTDEMRLLEAAKEKRAETLMVAGFLIFFIGLIWSVFAWVWRSRLTQPPPPHGPAAQL